MNGKGGRVDRRMMRREGERVDSRMVRDRGMERVGG